MKIRSVEFAGVIAEPGAPPPDGLPQVAFSGRSNVGKSSLINTLLRRTRKKIAHVSGTPGKTQLINFFRVNGVFFLVDLPGFGFARVSKKMRASWKTLTESYLGGKHGPQGVVHLVDARHPPTSTDLRMVRYLADLGLPTLVALTKIDRVGASRRTQTVADAAAALGVEDDQIVPCSSKTGEGREELLAAIVDLLELDEEITTSE